jgi:hypothetical protein
MADKKHPLSKTQKTVLDALSLSAEHWHEAEQVFAAHGLAVEAKRSGRSYVPVVTKLPATTVVGGFNIHGEGESAEIDHEYKPVDLAKISQWMEE